MAITDILSAAQGGQYFVAVGTASGLSAPEAKSAVFKFAPRIAAQLKDKAAADPAAFDALLDLLEEGGDSSDLDDAEAMTGNEALADGAAILGELYGSRAAANSALGVSAPAQEKAAALSATGVVAALAASNAATLASRATSETGGAGGGLIAIIIAAILKGIMQSVSRQLAPKRRRRRYTYSTRRRTIRRRTSRPGLDDIFRDILTGRK